jgi:ribosomal protein S18 acetylase RimI-like enzyme
MLTPSSILHGSQEFQSILNWPFPSQPFYAGQVRQVISVDIPHRMVFGACQMWTYLDQQLNTVGFGTLDFCMDYASLSGGNLHGYIPVLAVHPSFTGQGHGHRIVDHLIAEAKAAASGGSCSNLLFLDVYVANTPAISLYRKHGFTVLNQSNPISDQAQNNEPYYVMAARIA